MAEKAKGRKLSRAGDFPTGQASFSALWREKVLMTNQEKFVWFVPKFVSIISIHSVLWYFVQYVGVRAQTMHETK